MKDPAKAFLAALQRDEACLHPTDTLPGLTFHPEGELGFQAVCNFKGRLSQKPFIGLVASPVQALKFWQPLPHGWQAHLEKIWPGPVSIIWHASLTAPARLVAEDGTIALRVPKLRSEAGWFKKVLEQMPLPLATTSVNRSGEPPACSWGAAKALLKNENGFYLPPAVFAEEVSENLPSTIIKLNADGGFSLVRDGAMPLALLKETVFGKNHS